MPRITLAVTQGGADTFTTGLIDTGLSADGKAAWSIYAIRAWWVNGAAVAAVDHSAFAKVSTLATTTTFTSADEIDRVGWGVQNTGGVAVAYTYDPIKEHSLFEPRITVQPFIYVQNESTATGQANQLQIQIFYDIVKLTDLEVLRLLAGGA